MGQTLKVTKKKSTTKTRTNKNGSKGVKVRKK